MTNYDPENDEAIDGGFSLSDENDIQIIMHRDTHFGGQFPIMLDYYRNDGIGVMEEFDIERIEELADYEARTGANLAALLLTGPDAERIAKARNAYATLKAIYETRDVKNRHPQLIADLILTEEAFPEEEINAVIAEKSAIVPHLIDIIESEDFYDPLFPGYGLAPQHALTCLQKIGDKRAIIALFESIGKHDFFNEDTAIHALQQIGPPAKEFLLRVLKSNPITYDNERAATALIAFEDDEDVASVCWELLRNLDLRSHLSFAGYLILACEGLKNPQDRQDFTALAQSPGTPRELKSEFDGIIHSWRTHG